MNDRGIIKWRPFNSCFSTEKLSEETSNQNAKITMPVLSEDQILTIENMIVEAFYLKIKVNIKFFYDGKIKYENGIIDSINKYEKKIYLKDKSIYFKQILDINFN